MKKLFALLACLAFPVGVPASGPYGGSVTGIQTAADGDSLGWAATDRGLFRFDHGRWARVASLSQRELRAVLDLGGSVVAVEAHRGVLRTEDGGGTWTEANVGLRGRYGHAADDVRTLVRDRADPLHLYLGAAGQGAFESRDGGRRWTLLLPGLEEQPAPAFHPTALLPPAQGRPLLMGTDGLGLFRWEEGRWRPIEEGGLPEGLRVQALATSSGNLLHVALATRGAGLWESRDGGTSWTKLRAGAFGVVGAVAVSADGTVLAHFPEEGLVLARDGKAGRPTGLGDAKVLCLQPRAGGGWFAGLADDGVLELSPEGVPVGARNGGLEATKVLSLLPGGVAGRLWAGDANGVFFSGDEGVSWEVRDGGLLGAPASNLLTSSEGVLLGTGGQGVFLWRPESSAWEPRSGGLGTSNTIFALQADVTGKRLYVGTEGGVYASDDDGITWSPRRDGLPGGSVWLVAASPVREGMLWAAGAGRIFRSDDGGQTWRMAFESKAVGLRSVSAGERDALWVLEEGRLLRAEGDSEPQVVFTALRNERFQCLEPEGDSLWLGTSQGLRLVTGGDGRAVWDGAGILSLLWVPGEGVLLAGTDGRGVTKFRVR